MPYIKLPYYTINNGKVYYLNKVCYLNTNSKIINKVMLKDYGLIIKKLVIKKNKVNKERLLFIEPHPDDIAYSCGGFLIKKAKTNNIDVLTIFTRSSLKTFPWRKLIKISEDDYEKLRITESKIAINDFAGCNNKIMNLKQALLRGHKMLMNNLIMKILSLSERLRIT
ncbi:MAG: hypothetical protein WC307_02670 [Candidatus Nanoarchaeia archaeon]|jgi:hypothetical protein